MSTARDMPLTSTEPQSSFKASSPPAEAEFDYNSIIDATVSEIHESRE